MKCFNRFRAKDPVLAAIISMGMIMSAQAIAGAQANDWEEVGPSSAAAQQQLMSAPPQIGANVSGYRPPVSTPVVAAANNAIQSEYTVQAGDTLPKIAMKVYGDPNRWQDLMVLNNIDNGNRIYVGQKLITVANSAVMEAEEAPVAQYEIDEAPEESADADASYFEGLNSDGTYTIKKGDTLGKIAKEYLGSTSKWQKIAKANPSIDPNKLAIGDVITIPGVATKKASSRKTSVVAQPLGVTHVAEREVSSQPWQMASSNAVNNYGYAQQVNVEPPSISAPSFDPNTAPLVAPPPPPAGMYGNYVGGSPVNNNYNTNVYSGDMMAPPPPAPPMTAPDVPYISPSEPVQTESVSADPVAVSNRELYREEKYRLPDELKATDYDPYFTNMNGYRGLFNTETALIPYLPTWNIAFHYKFEDLKYFGGEKNIIDGDRSLINLDLNYTGNKFFAGITVPFQAWHESVNGGSEASLNGLHDTRVRAGYQVWKNLEGTHAVTLHVEGRIAGGNYHHPIIGQNGLSNGLKTKHDSVIGPADATKGSWVEVGGAYSGQMGEKWTNHINMSIANNSKDDVTKFSIKAGTDYRVNRNFSLVGEICADSYEAPSELYGDDGINAELVLGMQLFNDSWGASLGFPINIKQEWGTQSSYGVIFGLSHRWD